MPGARSWSGTSASRSSSANILRRSPRPRLPPGARPSGTARPPPPPPPHWTDKAVGHIARAAFPPSQDAPRAGVIVLPYWLLFSFFAVGAIRTTPDHLQARRTGPVFLFGAIAIALMIGLRYHVGGDWTAYDRMFLETSWMDLREALLAGDPAYTALNWFIN